MRIPSLINHNNCGIQEKTALYRENSKHKSVPRIWDKQYPVTYTEKSPYKYVP